MWRALELQHHAGLAHPSGGEHQDVLALIQEFPDAGKLVVPSVEVVSDDGLSDYVAESYMTMKFLPKITLPNFSW